MRKAIILTHGFAKHAEVTYEPTMDMPTMWSSKMLKLTRDPGQLIIIGDNKIRIRYVKLTKKGVQFEIEADESIPIHKKEWLEKNKA